MKIAFFGTPEFAGEILSGILDYPEINVKLVVSQTDKPVGRKKDLLPTPVKEIAIKNDIEVIQVKNIKKDTEFHEYLESLDLDFIVVVAYGKIIPQKILGIPKYGCINIHGSILPKYRGASPVQSAIKAGESETGLTIMYMSEGMDQGDMLQIEKVNIDILDTSQDVFKKFVHIGPKLLVNTLKNIVSGEIEGTPQNEKDATYCGKISREDGRVFFEKQEIQEICNTFRAYTPWPGIFSFYEEKRLVLEEISLYQGEEEFIGEVGEFIKISKNRYGIVCLDKRVLEVLRVKLEGKKSMDMISFVNGSKEIVGYQLQ